MPIPFAVMAGASLLGSGISAFSQANAAKKNLRAQQARQRMIDAGAAQNAGVINSGLGNISSMLSALAGQGFNSQQANPNAFSFDPISGQNVSAPQYDANGFAASTAGNAQATSAQAGLPGAISADMVDVNSLFSGQGSQGYNVGQDALMQFLRSDPAGKMQGSSNVLEEIAATGLPSDLSSMFAGAADVNRVNNQELLASVTGRSRSVGERFGSSTRRLEGDTARRLANEQSLQNSQLALQAGESAANRRLGAATQLGQFQLQGQGQLLQGAGQLLQSGQAQQQTILQAMLANQGSNLQANQFNANLANSNNQFNAGQMNNMSQFNANLANSNNQFNAGQMNAAGQFNAASQNQAGAQNAQMLLQSLLANQANGQRTNEFNIGTALNANQSNNAQMMQAIFGNNQQMIAERGLQQNALGQAGGLAGQQAQLLNQLLGIRAGVQTPQANPAGGQAMGGAFQDLASIMQAFNRYGGQGGNKVPNIPNVYIPPVDIGRVG